jgi:hypothetical protein
MRALVLSATICVLVGCGHMESAGPTERLNKSFDLDKSEIVKAEFHMGVGELKVSGGAAKLAEVNCEWNVPSWKPTVDYSSTGFRGTLKVAQKSSSNASFSDQTKNRWDIKMNDTVAVDYDFKFGVGEADIKLGSANIRSLELNMGVGEVKMDLRGNPKKDYSVSIRGGVGEATIYLPKDVAIVADAKGGIGGIHTTGLKEEGGRYVNESYKKRAPVTIRLDIKGGVGAINLYAE